MKTEQRQYKFLEASWILMISTFIGSMVLNLFLIVKIGKALDLPKNGFTEITKLALIILAPVLVSRLVSFNKTTITLNKKEIKINRNSPIGLPFKSDIILPYSKIHEYIFQEDQNWYWLKILDVDGNVYRIWKLSLLNNKEFKAFRDRFINEISWYNQESISTDDTTKHLKQIKVARNFYRGTEGLVLALISIIVMIAAPVFIITNGINNLSSIGPFLIGLSGAVYTFFRVLSERTKEKHSN